MDTIIRMVRDTDLDAVTRVEAACFPEAEAADRESFSRRIAVFPDCFFVAEKDGAVIGFINGCATDESTICDAMFEDTGYHKKDGAYQSIFGLDVMPGYQHQGLASSLMNHMIGDARRRGRTGLILTCKEHLTGFYEQFGYRCLGRSASTHGNAEWYDMILEF